MEAWKATVLLMVTLVLPKAMVLLMITLVAKGEGADGEELASRIEALGQAHFRDPCSLPVAVTQAPKESSRIPGWPGASLTTQGLRLMDR